MMIVQARLLFWSLRHRRARHLLNAVSTGVSVAIVVVFVAVLVEFRAYTHAQSHNQLARILVAPKLVLPGSFSDGLPVSMKPAFEHIEGVKIVQRKLVFGGRHESGATYLVAGEEDSGVEQNTDFYPVSAEVIEAWKKERRIGALVTADTARDLHLEVGQTTEIPTPYGPMQIKVVGLYSGLFANGMAVHFDYIQQFTKNTQTSGYRVLVDPPAMEHVIAEIAALTRNSPMPARGMDSSKFRAAVARRLASIPALLGFLGLFLLFTTALTLANNSAISIRERRIEVATLRVLGFYPRSILQLLVSEAMIVGIAGGFAAVAILLLVFHGGVQLTPHGLLPPAQLGPVAIGAGIAVSVLVPLAGALPSAVAAVRVRLVDGLRQTA